MIKAIIFDCFGVIYTDPAQIGFNKFAADPSNQIQAFNELLRLSNEGKLNREELHQREADILDVPLEKWKALISSSLAKDQTMLDTILSLRKTYLTGLLTNLGPKRLHLYFTKEELELNFDVAVASGDIGFAKPDKRAFQYVLDKLGVEPEQAVFVDDRENYLAGAIELGMETILFENLHQFKNALKVLVEG